MHNKCGGNRKVRQQRGSTLHGPLVTIASQVQARIEIKFLSSVLFRLEEDIAEVLPTGSGRCIAVIPKICCHQLDQQRQTVP